MPPVAFSVTEVESFMRCRRQWNITSFNRWGLSHTGSPSLALDLGSLCHKSLADWTLKKMVVPPSPTQIAAAGDDEVLPQIVDYNHPDYQGKTYPNGLEDLFNVHTMIRIDNLKRKYRETVGTEPNETELQNIYDAHELGGAMMRNYQEYHGSPLPKRMQFVSPEQEVMVPVPGTEHPCDKCDGTGYITDVEESVECEECQATGTLWYYLKGTLDALVQDTRDRLYIIEHKTFGAHPNEASLRRNFQFTAYIWILKQLDIGKVGGLCYDGMWKRKAPPRGKTMEDMFLRHIEHRNQAQLEHFEMHLAPKIIQMATTPQVPVLGDLPELYPTVPWKGCFDCTVSDLCDAMERNENPESVLKRHYTKRESEAPMGMLAGVGED